MPQIRASLVPLLLALVAPGAAAQEQGPICADWGPNPEQKVRDLFNHILEHSGYDNPEALAAENRQPTKLKYWDKTRLMEGSPAVALGARTGPNPKDYSLVIVTFGALEACPTPQHMAAMLAHEISHLVLGHPKDRVDKMKGLVDKEFQGWFDREGEAIADACEADHPKPECEDQVYQKFSKKYKKEIGEFMKPMEDAADLESVDLLAVSGFDPHSGARMADSMNDWLAAIGSHFEDSEHDPPRERARKMEEAANQIEHRDSP